MDSDSAFWAGLISEKFPPPLEAAGCSKGCLSIILLTPQPQKLLIVRTLLGVDSFPNWSTAITQTCAGTMAPRGKM